MTIATDIDYVVERVLGAYFCRAAFAAVLTPLYGRSWYGWGVPAALAKLRDDWQARLDGLRAAHWPPAQRRAAGDGYLYLRNCPPFGVRVGDGSGAPLPVHACHRTPVCPFCYARRYVFQATTRCARLLYGSATGRKAAPPGLNLVEFVSYGSIRVDPWTADNLALTLHDQLVFVRAYRRVEVDTWSAAGGGVLHRLRFRPPKDKGGVGKVQVLRSGLLVTATVTPRLRMWRQRADGARGPRDKVRLHKRPTRKVLARAAARALRYSPDWLWGLPAELAVAALRGLARTRLYSSYGNVTGL